jgi:uncharacterized protein
LDVNLVITALEMADEGALAVDEWGVELRHSIERAAHLLPSQGPITVFVHHNTLHAFEDRPFDEGVKAGGGLFGCNPYLPEDRYRKKLESGRIRVEDLEAVLLEDLGDEADRLVASFGTRYALRLSMMQFPLHSGPPAELRWTVAETEALRKFREEVDHAVRDSSIEQTRHWVMRDLRNGGPHDAYASRVVNGLVDQLGRRSIESWSDQKWESFVLQLLWRVCRKGVVEVSGSEIEQSHAATPRRRRLRDELLDATGRDTDALVHEILIPLTSAFLDQGFADSKLPNHESGLFGIFLRLYSVGFAPTGWQRRLKVEAIRLSEIAISPLESIAESFAVLGVSDTERDEFIEQSLLALRGFAGMVWQMETNAEWAPHPVPAGSLNEFFAVQLVLERMAIEHVARESLHFDGPLADVRRVAQEAIVQPVCDSTDARAFEVFQLAQVRGWKPHELFDLSPQQWVTLIEEIESFSSLERRRVYHLAFERKYRNETLDAVAIHSDRRKSAAELTPTYQVVCCIDDREESFRRHLEEVGGEDCETFGFAGFYGVAMFYRGTVDAHFKPLCPVSIKPMHYVTEEPLYSLVEAEYRRSDARRRIGRATHKAHLGSRSFLGGLLTTLAGSFAAFPLVARILFPRLTAQIRNLIGRIVEPPTTQLRIERVEPEAGFENGRLGFSVDEMTAIVEGVLRAIGLTRSYSRLVVFLGHGSSSLNNPHESAYNCGACSGSQGGPNARAFAQMANDHRVRGRLNERGLTIPESTVFVGGYHDTTSDSVTYADLDRLPMSHRSDFERALLTIDETRARNAHERCRRFESADLDISIPGALRHVEVRPQDLSQARPEYNHATNALCLVGRREWSRGLFLDRRAFLASYDPRQDDDRGSILEETLRPVISVCAGINLEYYFSTVDVEGFGCGSKLPHNITSLLGVMSGASSDLRPGLSQQMIEIHEPMRILFIVETTSAAMRRIIDENEAIARLVNGDWVQLAILDAESSTILRYVNGEFVAYEPESRELPTADSSLDWYRGWRDHLGFASIREAVHS